MARHLSNWIDGLLKYTQDLESPDNYLIWAALHTISAATQRHVWTKWLHWTIYPNVYVLLVGPAGGRKTAAIKISKKMLRDVGVAIASEAQSKEMLVQQMKTRGADTQALAVVVSEFASFFATSGPPMVTFLTDIWDCEEGWEYSTKSGGTVQIERPFLTILGAIVPDWIATEFDATFVQSGFASRVHFVVEHGPRFHRAFGKLPTELYNHLVEDLMDISTQQGEFEWAQGALDWFKSWYETVLPKEEFDYRLGGYKSRKAVHLIRLSMLVALATGATVEKGLVIEPAHFQQALALLEGLEPRMTQAFAAVGRNPYANDHERIAAEIAMHNGMYYGEIVERNIHAMDRKILDEVLANLEWMGKIDKEVRPGKDTRYVPSPEAGEE